MQRTIKTFTVDPQTIKTALLQWSQSFREFLFLDSNDYPDKYGSFRAALAADAFTSIATDAYNGFEKLEEYRAATADWIFGYLTYDLKNDTEKLSSSNRDELAFPELFFFQPKKLLFLKENTLELHYLPLCDDEIDTDFLNILSQTVPAKASSAPFGIHPRTPKPCYLRQVGKMLEHIHRGDIYEANFCMEFYAENAVIDPLDTFVKLNAISVPPFAAMFRNAQYYALCASPERYLRKYGSKIISQPIKGTAARHPDPEADQMSKSALAADAKERSENVMIVDLVRNDLSKRAVKGSVTVDELCGVYTFNQVHHLISTISSEVEHNESPVNSIRDSFPMGSMTGAPKISAMKIIEALEDAKRGLYSGSLGYFDPAGNFDFNVVIRTILYNAARQYVSFSTGSAITAQSTAEAEYEECMLKARAMMQVLSSS